MLMSGEMSDEKPRELFLKEKIDRWMVNEGYRRLYDSKDSRFFIMLTCVDLLLHF
jgi:hypothetical protein